MSGDCACAAAGGVLLRRHIVPPERPTESSPTVGPLGRWLLEASPRPLYRYRATMGTRDDEYDYLFKGTPPVARRGAPSARPSERSGAAAERAPSASIRVAVDADAIDRDRR